MLIKPAEVNTLDELVIQKDKVSKRIKISLVTLCFVLSLPTTLKAPLKNPEN